MTSGTVDMTARHQKRGARSLLDYSHNGWLVAASLAVAMLAGFSGLSLTQGVSALPIQQRKLPVAMSAIVLGGGIWSMHFVAMLGLRLPIPYYYDGLITLISALVAILMVGLALLVLHFRPRTAASITGAGAIVGVGILAMHYIGMAGMELCRPSYSVLGVAESAVASILLSILAIWVAYGRRSAAHILIGTLCFGLSVFIVHFIAIWQTAFFPQPISGSVGPALSNEALAMGVALATFVICGAFLLTGVTFLQPRPDHLQPRPESQDTSADVPAPKDVVRIPFERDGRTQFTNHSAVAAVRAEGHYTTLYLGGEKVFCPWSISEAERRLASTAFVRAHRSYLVNPSHVSEFKRTKDTGVCYFEDIISLEKVPVSRSRLRDVREALGI